MRGQLLENSALVAYVVQREGGRVDAVVQQTVDASLAVPRVAVDGSRENLVRYFLSDAHGEQTRRVVRVQITIRHTSTPT